MLVTAGLDQRLAIEPGHCSPRSPKKRAGAELYVTSFPRPGEKVQVSTSGLEHFMWDPTADRLLYVQEGRLLEAAIARKPTLSVGPRREVFDERPTRVVLSQTADITSNGRTFVVVQQPPMSEAALGAIVVVENWAERPRGDRSR